MSEFRIFVDGEVFYHPSISRLAITEAKVTEDIENIDSLVLTVPYDHPYLSSIKPLSSVIVCKQDDEVVFEGRALDEGSDFYNTHTWTCESSIAYLKDSIVPPYEYQGSLHGLLEYFIETHNASVEEQKRFVLGNITVEDNNDYIAYSNSDYSVTLDAIKDKLIDTHGGYLQVRYVGEVKYLDYLSDFSSISLQYIEYGKNLLDVKITKDHTKRVTALIPLGAKVSGESTGETDEENSEVTTEAQAQQINSRIDITSVNDGVNYIYDENAVNEIGWIWSVEVWEDVTIPGNLLSKARTRLAELVEGIISIELTIVDEAESGAAIGDIRARMYVDCYSKAHGIDGRYLVTSRTRDYLNPAGNTITIGASGVSLTSNVVKQNKNLTALEENITGQNSKIENLDSKVSGIDFEAIDSAVSLKEEVRECYSEIAKTSDEIYSTVQETYTTKTELEIIQADFQSDITQMATEVRFDFTTAVTEIQNNVNANQELLEEYIRFKGALIELGKVGNAFTTELSNEQLAFKENGQTIAYISNQCLVITNAEILNKLSLGNSSRGWFDFIPRTSGNLSIVWRRAT